MLMAKWCVWLCFFFGTRTKMTDCLNGLTARGFCDKIIWDEETWPSHNTTLSFSYVLISISSWCYKTMPWCLFVPPPPSGKWSPPGKLSRVRAWPKLSGSNSLFPPFSLSLKSSCTQYTVNLRQIRFFRVSCPARSLLCPSGRNQGPRTKAADPFPVRPRPQWSHGYGACWFCVHYVRNGSG